MQERKRVLTDQKTTSGIDRLMREETKVDKPVKLNPGILIPTPLRKKKFNNELITALNETYEREPLQQDEYGSYKEGVFIHGNNIVHVSRIEDRWHLSIQSDKTLSIYEMKAARYKFIPDQAYMTIVLPERNELDKFTSPNSMQMIEITVEKTDKK